MFRSIFFLNWRAGRPAVTLLSCAVFIAPILAVQGILLGPDVPVDGAVRARVLLEALESWTVVFPALALATGVLLGTAVWSWDHQEGHVYALTLPVERGRYVLMKMGSGLLLVLIPVALFLAGSWVATAATEIPEGLRAYPGSLALRFTLASALSFGLVFALASGSRRSVVRAVAALVVLLVVVSLAGSFSDAGQVPSSSLAQVLDAPAQALIHHPWSPVRVFTGSWMLVDV